MPKHFKTKAIKLLNSKIADLTKKLDDALHKEQGSRVIALAAMGIFARMLKKRAKNFIGMA